MSQRLLARRYAKALFQIAEKTQRLASTGTALQQVEFLVRTNSDLQHLISSVLVPPKKKAEIFLQILQAGHVPELLQHFFQVVAENGRLHLLGDIETAYRELLDQSQGLLEAQVTTAVRLNELQSASLSQRLAERTGKRIRLRQEIDPSILGGIRVQIGSTILDATILNQLHILKRQLISH